MSKLLGISNVFIDTSVFVGRNYAYDSPVFQALKNRVAQGRTRVVLTDVTVEEVKCHIREDAKSAVAALKKVRKDVKILRNLPKHSAASIFADIDESALADELIQRFEQFLSDVSATVVPVSQADTSQVFRSYFDGCLPFSAKKKDEFPDAFALSAVNAWAAERGEEVHVVSRDRDMDGLREHLPCLLPATSVEQYLDEVTRQCEALSELAVQVLRDNASAVNASIKDEFRALGFILVDQDGDVGDVGVVEVDEIEPYLISLERGHGNEECARFELSATVRYTADVSYADMDTAMWDSEDKVAIPWQTIHAMVEDEEEVTVDMELSFDPTSPHLVTICRIMIQSPKDVEVRTEADEYPYK